MAYVMRLKEHFGMSVYSERLYISVSTMSVVGRRKGGKPRTKWIDNVEDDLRKMGIKRWRLTTADRIEWRGICEAVRVLEEL
jgi:hypothetical protein